MQITISQWKEEYIPDLIKYANNKNIARNLRDLFPFPYTEEDAKTWIYFNKDLKPALNMAIILNGKVIGGVGIMLKEDIHRKNAEIGYWVAEDYWGKGFATHAARLMVEHTFNNFDVTRIYASTFDFNVASQRVLEKIGFVKEARLKKALFKNGRYVDEVIMSLLKENFLLQSG